MPALETNNLRPNLHVASNTKAAINIQSLLFADITNSMTELNSNHDILRQAFPIINKKEIALLSQASLAYVYPPEMVIRTKGVRDSQMFVLVEGKANISIQLDDGQELPISTIKTGDYFGEIGPLGDTIRTVTVSTVTTCHVLAFEAVIFLEVLNRNPRLMLLFVRQMSNYLRETDRAIIRKLQRATQTIARERQYLEQKEQRHEEFLTMLSHELRTPLTTIQGYVHLINQGSLTEKAAIQGLQAVSQSVEEIISLVNRLLKMYETQVMSLTSRSF